MKEAVEIQVEIREPGSSNQARRLRRDGKIPAVLYGEDRDPRSIVVNPRDLVRILTSDQGENTILSLSVGDGQGQTALIHDYQVDPISHRILHADFKRISMDVEVEVQVPVHILGEPLGVRRDGGVLDQVVRELTVRCLPGAIPDSFDIDVSKLEIGDSVHVSDIVAPEGVVIDEDMEQTIANVAPPQELELETEEEEDLLGEMEEPELIRPDRDDEDEDED